MAVKDHHGLELTGASPAAAELYQTALGAYHRYAGDAMSPLDAAIADSPRFVMAHLLKAYMTLIGGNTETQTLGVQAFTAAKDLSCNSREAGHMAALGSLLAGEIHGAARILEDVAIAHPRDTVALHAGQLCDFLVGDSRMLRDRIARALPAWSADAPDYHAVQGMLAFGLEETGLYAQAETAGRLAIELEPRNNWAQHAVAHVMLMQGRHAEGVRWMRHDNVEWQPQSELGVHNWWHTAIFHLALGETDQVLELYDGPIYGEPSTFGFDLADAAALLWRLKLLGVDAGARWQVLADAFLSEPRGRNAFVDTHAMMALVGAGREAEAVAVLDAQAAAVAGPGDNALFVREVGQSACQAIFHFGRGEYARCVEQLRTVRNRSVRFGGSHAQRDVLDLTLIAAAELAGETSLHRALLAERAAAAPLAPAEVRKLAA